MRFPLNSLRPLSLLFLLIFIAPRLQADSPLTSTPFHEAYLDLKIVSHAKETGVVDKKIAKYLLNRKKPIALKAAVVNALGWDFNGKQNAELFLGYLADKRGITAENQNWDLLTAHDLMCIGYMMALDNYFDCEAAEKVLLMARGKEPKNHTIALVHALVLAQVLFDSDWCLSWRAVSDVDKDPDLQIELREEAMQIVMSYMILYKDEC